MRELTRRTGGRFNFFDGRDDGKHEVIYVVLLFKINENIASS